MRYTAAGPAGHAPDAAVRARARALGGEDAVRVVEDPVVAVEGADVLYTDVWFSMGQDREPGKEASLRPYQLNAELLARAAPQAVVMHCLPAHRGEEITDEVIDGPRSLVWDQAENRMHAQAALLRLLVGE
jgi:ornithine carbamoyltransferase